MMIGQLARQAGVNIETVRYYERRGLLPEPVRTSAGYRRYDREAVARLGFIRRAKRLGFTLHEIEELLDLRVRDPAACRTMGRRTRDKLAVVRRKIRELQAMERSLRQLSESCEARRRTGECPILDALDGTEEPEPRGPTA